MLARLGFPAIGSHRRFVTAIGVDAIGSGVFMPISLLYFVAASDLTLVAIGAAVSLGNAVAIPASPLLGGLIDRYGARTVLLSGNVLQGLGFAGYLFADSFVAVLGWTALIVLGRSAFWGSYGNIVALISRQGEREKWFGFLGALRNVGFAIGGLVVGLALGLDRAWVYDAVVLVNAASYVLAFLLLLSVRAPHRATGDGEDLPGSWRTVLADGPYRLLVVVQAGFCLAIMVLNVAIPVYAVETLGLPGWVTGVVFTLNTVMIGVGQGLVVRGMTGAVRWRVLVATHLVFAVSFLVLWGASWVPVAGGVVVMVLGAAIYTLGELTGSPVLGALAAEAAPEHLRGRYLSMVQLAWNLTSTVAPVTFTWLLARGAGPLWWVLGALALVTALLAVRLGRTLPQACEPITNEALDPAPA